MARRCGRSQGQHLGGDAGRHNSDPEGPKATAKKKLWILSTVAATGRFGRVREEDDVKRALGTLTAPTPAKWQRLASTHNSAVCR